MNQVQDQWSSRWAFILAATGAAVGLGNLWRFPYMAGMNGGSAFVLIYIICVIVIGLPIMVSEILIGRRARRNSVDALSALAKESGRSERWRWLGWWGALALLLVLSFYSVVAGWSIAYLIKTVTGQLSGDSAAQISQVWTQFLANPWRLIAWHTVFMLLTIGVIVRGVQQGLEKASTMMMPLLYAILIALVLYAAVVGNFGQAVHFLFDFHLDKITPSVVIAAMGHAFFSLALGGGAMLTYGAYVSKRVNLAKAVAVVAFLDVMVAFLSGLAIFPIVFANNLPPSAGPGLMFVSLPIAFAHMGGGAIIGSLFFILLIFAAWTSSINLAEPLVIILMKKLNLGRKAAAILVGGLAWTLGLGSALSFNVWKNVKIFGDFSIFSVATNLPTDIILPIGGIGFAIFTGWIMRRHATREEVHDTVYPLWRFLVRYVGPLAVAVIMVGPLIG